jgi:hypothetical protein
MSSSATLISHKAKSSDLITSIDTSITSSTTSITKIEKKLPKVDTSVTHLICDAIKLQDSQKNLKARIEFPELVSAASELDQALLKIRVLEYRLKEEITAKERYMKKFSEAALEAMRAKNEKKALVKTVAQQSLDMEDIRSEVTLYMKESAEGYKRLEVSHEAYAAELEDLLEYKREDKRAAADRLECMAASSTLWSN